MPLNLMWTRSSYFCLFFLFKYDELIIKQPSGCTFDIKVKKIRKFWKNFKNKKTPLSSPPLTNLGKCRSFRGGLDNVEYGNTYWGGPVIRRNEINIYSDEYKETEPSEAEISVIDDEKIKLNNLLIYKSTNLKCNFYVLSVELRKILNL